MECVNLKDRFGSRYRAWHENTIWGGPKAVFPSDPWLQVIPCQFGHIAPWGGELLAASVDGHRGVAGRLRRLACVSVVQDGDFGELTATFHVDDFDAVAEVMRPRRRRVMNPDAAAANIERLRAFRFPSADKRQSTEQKCVRTPPVVF
jgi:hypothetical protein